MQIAMVIDLQKCAGCGACAIACKTENNTQGRARGQTFNWADFIYAEGGKFPNVEYSVLPVRCNHCREPECIKGCPKPQALYKSAEGLTLYNYRYCIQCKKCQDKCPYSALDVDKQKVAYSVISYNEVGIETHERYKDKTALIKGCTESGAEVAKAVGMIPPYKHEYSYRDDKKPRDPKLTQGKGDMKDVRSGGWVEKCTFCVHRLRKGEEAYCVASCPAKARTVGDVDDPGSEVSRLIKKYKPMMLKNNKGEWLKENEPGTKPNVYYIRKYQGGVHAT
ncbi:MAG: 4Fe-4S dicluster domain-containing protein [Desulfobacteria bacterium]